MIEIARRKPVCYTFPDKSHPLQRGLVGHWIMWEGVGKMVMDVSGHGNHGTMTNMDPATDWVPGKFGPCLDFDGTDDYVSVPDNPDLRGLNQLTFTMRLYSHTYGDVDRCSLANNLKYNYSLHSDTAEPGAGWRIYINGVQHVPSIAPQMNVWEHIAVVFNGDNPSLDFYLNGVATNISTTETSTGNTSGSLLIGSYSTSAKRFDGLIDDVRIYNRALLPEEIEQLYREPYADFVETKVKYFYVAPPPTGVSIPVFMRAYRNRRVA